MFINCYTETTFALRKGKLRTEKGKKGEYDENRTILESETQTANEQ